VDRRTKNLLARLDPGDVALIRHRDIDRISAEGLLQRKPRAVVNADSSMTGRYPNLGPLLLCSAGIPLIDEAGDEVMGIVEGSVVEVDAGSGRIYSVEDSKRREVARGRVLELADIEKRLDRAKQSIAIELEAFAENTMEYIKEERDVLLEAARLPDVRLDFHGRPVLVVVRGYDYKEDLAALRGYIREVRPIMIGVDGGADALLDAGLKPDMIIGDMDSVTTEALLTGAELVVHAYTGGEAPGLERLDALGLPCEVFEATGTSEDIAMLLAYERGAELIVAVGTHTNLVELMDKGRKGMASTFLTRLRVGPVLVDAKGVSRLYRGGIRRRDLLLLILVTLLTIVVAVWISEPLRLQIELYWTQFTTLVFDLRNAIFGAI
jgi:uncharacterized membrane-anchored protein